MKNHLYFVCPTDNLETVIDGRGREANYYLTSLGNSMVFNEAMMTEINALVEAKNITEITFALSDDNRIVTDVLNGRDLASIEGLDRFHGDISIQEQRAKLLWQVGSLQGPVLSQYLHERINELSNKLNDWLVERTEMNAKIYHRHRDVFSEFSGDLFQREFCSLN